MQKTLILMSLLLIVAGIIWPWIIRLGLGHLPGDIIIKQDKFTFYFPIATSILVSIILSIVLWWLNR